MTDRELTALLAAHIWGVLYRDAAANTDRKGVCTLAVEHAQMLLKAVDKKTGSP